MLDINLEFTPKFTIQRKCKVDVLTISSCAVHYFAAGRLWSTFEDESYCYLNSNDFNCGVIDFEIGFTGYTGQPYPKLYSKCFRLLTDTKVLIKPMKKSNEPFSSKVNSNGELIVSLRYHFHDEDEINSLINCKKLLIESFVAFDKPTNTYSFAIQLERDEDDKWVSKMANTYRIRKKDNIKYLMD